VKRLLVQAEYKPEFRVRSVCRCVVLSVGNERVRYLAKTVDSIEMLSEVVDGWAQGRRTMYYMGVQLSSTRMAVLGEMGQCNVMYRENAAPAMRPIPKLLSDFLLLPPPKKEVMFLVRSVCLFVRLFVCLSVCLSVGLLANL